MGGVTTRTTAARSVSTDTAELLTRLDHHLAAREASPAPVVDEDGWVPGDPIHERPRFGDEQWVRPMVEVLDDDFGGVVPRCSDCQVSWLGDDACWVCGDGRPVEPARRRQTSVTVTVDVQPFLTAMAQAAAAMAESLSRVDFTALRRALATIDAYDRHHPKPLAIDGHEYARRRRNRR